MPVFLLLPFENECLQAFSTINADNNEELTIKHGEKKFYVRFVEGFSDLLYINITWRYGNLNVKPYF